MKRLMRIIIATILVLTLMILQGQQKNNRKLKVN